MLGISIYPEKSDVKKNIDYINLAHKYGFKRIFTCLLSVDKPKDEIIKDFSEIIQHARQLNFEVVLDVSPRIFDELEISYDDLTFFGETRATGIRLDMGFDGVTEAKISYNPQNLDIEINISNDTHYVDMIMDYKPNRAKIIGSHNFYPQRWNRNVNPYESYVEISRWYSLGLK